MFATKTGRTPVRKFAIGLAAACAVALAAGAASAQPAPGVTKYLGPMNAQEQKNAENVVAFYNAAINDKDFAKARPYLGDKYIQHNPTAQDGFEGFTAFLTFLKTSAPTSHSDILRVFATGDYVILHVKSSRPDPRGRAIVDIFRLENGKVVEHWDVAQEPPEKPANTNTMF